MVSQLTPAQVLETYDQSEFNKLPANLLEKVRECEQKRRELEKLKRILIHNMNIVESRKKRIETRYDILDKVYQERWGDQNQYNASCQITNKQIQEFNDQLQHINSQIEQINKQNTNNRRRVQKFAKMGIQKELELQSDTELVATANRLTRHIEQLGRSLTKLNKKHFVTRKYEIKKNLNVLKEQIRQCNDNLEFYNKELLQNELAMYRYAFLPLYIVYAHTHGINTMVTDDDELFETVNEFHHLKLHQEIQGTVYNSKCYKFDETCETATFECSATGSLYLECSCGRANSWSVTCPYQYCTDITNFNILWTSTDCIDLLEID